MLMSSIPSLFLPVLGLLYSVTQYTTALKKLKFGLIVAKPMLHGIGPEFETVIGRSHHYYLILKELPINVFHLWKLFKMK
uniref:Uncharacterized protein n=1 Tax=Panagrolaimus sp. ES5 TaxID=591445 RepID=A0AC34FZ29_9BILA